MAERKYSRQREAIRQFLMERTDHPTADTIFENMKKVYPNISLGTVYRNLNLLSELGEIQKIPGFAGSDHFDGRTDLHCHFFCSECHQVTDLDNMDLSQIMNDVQQHFGGHISQFSGRFTGICENCLKKTES